MDELMKLQGLEYDDKRLKEIAAEVEALNDAVRKAAEARLAFDDEPAAFFEHDIGGTLDEIARQAVGDAGQRLHRARHDGHAGLGDRVGRLVAIRVGCEGPRLLPERIAPCFHRGRVVAVVQHR